MPQHMMKYNEILSLYTNLKALAFFFPVFLYSFTAAQSKALKEVPTSKGWKQLVETTLTDQKRGKWGNGPQFSRKQIKWLGEITDL